MDKKNKKGMPPYFNSAGGGAGGVGGDSTAGGSRKHSSKKFQKFNHKKGGGGGEEAIDIDIDDGADVVNVDSDEISAFVNKLGLNKFYPGVVSSPLGRNKVPKQKQAVKRLEKAIHKVGSAEEETKTTPKLKNQKQKHLRFEEKNGNVFSTEVDSDSVKKGKNKKITKKKDNKPGGVGDETPKPNPNVSKMFAKPSGSKWYEEQVSEGKDVEQCDERKGLPQQQPFIRQDDIVQIQKTANGLLEADVQAYKFANTTGSNKSDYQWMEKMMKTGTLPDRLAAYTVRIQDSPVHNLHFLQQLISMVKVQGKQQCMMTADTLRDLFLEDLLPPERKLVSFTNKGGQLKSATKRQLITWAFEDKLKILYSSFIDSVKRMAADTVEKLRGKGIVTVYQLLVGHPEQEETLLQVLVNKLGDPAKKMASRALFYLKQLLDEHPRMKRVVVEEVERLLFRNNISKRAQYYGVCFLNLVGLKDEHASLAHKLITVYIAFFKACVKTGDIDTKMMSGLLTGINRAFPQAREFGFQFSENLDTLYKIVQFSQFTISIQALCILFQIVDVAGNPTGADRFYRVLYEKLNTPEFKTSSHNAQFLNLIFKALKADTILNRVIGFTKRLLQICQSSTANLTCAILFLLSEVAKVHPQCVRVGNHSERELATQIKSEEVTDTSDSDDEEEKNSKTEKIAALEKLMKSSNIRINIDVPEREGKTCKSGIPSIPELLNPIPVIVIGNEVSDEKPLLEDVKPDIRRILTQYDPYARNPCYSGAEHSLAFELMTLSHHFHPSVALFAQTLTKRKPIKYDGNPLRDFTLTRFLERFSYRNAKPGKNRAEYQPKGLRNVPVNSENYLSMEEDKIPIEEKFFYRFFTTKKVKKKQEGNDEEEDTSDVESIGDDEFDALMGNYFKSTQGADDSDEEDIEDSMDRDVGKVDFASGWSTTTAKGKKRKQDDSESEDDEDDDDEFERDDGDEFISMDDDGDFDDGLSEGDDGMGMFEDNEDEVPSFANKRKKMKSMKGDDMFAPAEEFADMLEENAEEVSTGSQTLINRDRSDKKQLKWEIDRDRWAKGTKKPKSKGHNKKKFKRS